MDKKNEAVEEHCKEIKPEVNKNKAVADIIKNYQLLERSIVSQLNFAYEKHSATTGNHRESIWKAMFEQMIPEKFSIEQGVFIIDSTEGISREVDLAIFDETYTPYIFKYGELKFIPIEAVAAVIECKSGNLSNPGLKKWADSINALKTGIGAIARLNSHVDLGEEVRYDQFKKDVIKPQTQTSTRPIKILCHMSEKDNKAHYCFDLTIRAYDDKMNIYEHKKFQKLADIYKTLNHHQTEDRNIKPFTEEIDISKYVVAKKENDQVQDEVALMSLMFKLNQILMLVNNPIFFPHQAYVSRFSKGLMDLEESNGGNASGATD